MGLSTVEQVSVTKSGHECKRYSIISQTVVLFLIRRSQYTLDTI